MLQARDLIEIDYKHPDEEVVRLGKLHAALDNQPAKMRRKVADELLDIVVNPNEEISARMLACNGLNFSQLQSDLNKTKVAAGLNRILNSEFILYRRSGFPFLKNKMHLGKIRFLKLCLLGVLLSTLIRIDFINSHRLIERIINLIENSQIKAGLLELFRKQKLDLYRRTRNESL